ncbi:MAG: ABC transporter permease [Bacteroidales bacterium]|nr:ABC transporter permease [Bacteroidales bacterium]
MLARLSWRNIWRNKTRSLVVIFAIAVGLTGGIFITGMMNGMTAQQANNMINREISDIQIHHPDFLENSNPKFLINDVTETLLKIKSEPLITEASYRSKSTAMASTATKGAGVTIFGIIPLMEKKVSSISNKIVQGDYFETETKSQAIVIGEKLAHKLNAEMGKKIVVTAQALNGEMSWSLFRVVGIFKTNDTRFDEMNVFVKKEDLDKSLGIGADQANEIAIRTLSQEDAAAVAESLQSKFSELSVQSWREIKPSLIVMMTMMDQFGYWLMIIILFALVFGIINTMLMVIMERKKELGMLMSVGMNKPRVFWMIMMETTMLSLVGAAIGLMISIGLMELFGFTGINFASWADGLEAMGYSSFVYPYVTSEFYVIVTILVIITAIIASIWPTRKALKLNPAEAVRAE